MTFWDIKHFPINNTHLLPYQISTLDNLNNGPGPLLPFDLPKLDRNAHLSFGFKTREKGEKGEKQQEKKKERKIKQR